MLFRSDCVAPSTRSMIHYLNQHLSLLVSLRTPYIPANKDMPLRELPLFQTTHCGFLSAHPSLCLVTFKGPLWFLELNQAFRGGCPIRKTPATACKKLPITHYWMTHRIIAKQWGHRDVSRQIMGTHVWVGQRSWQTITHAVIDLNDP